jgi:hypothetical protein
MMENHPAFEGEKIAPWIPIFNKYEIFRRFANKVCDGSAEGRTGISFAGLAGSGGRFTGFPLSR